MITARSGEVTTHALLGHRRDWMRDMSTDEVLSIEDIFERVAARRALPVTHPGHPDGFTVDDKYVSIYWGGYEYWISWDRIRTPVELLDWLEHITAKSWEGTTPERISNLINVIRTHRGWR